MEGPTVPGMVQMGMVQMGKYIYIYISFGVVVNLLKPGTENLVGDEHMKKFFAPSRDV